MAYFKQIIYIEVAGTKLLKIVWLMVNWKIEFKEIPVKVWIYFSNFETATFLIICKYSKAFLLSKLNFISSWSSNPNYALPSLIEIFVYSNSSIAFQDSAWIVWFSSTKIISESCGRVLSELSANIVERHIHLKHFVGRIFEDVAAPVFSIFEYLHARMREEAINILMANIASHFWSLEQFYKDFLQFTNYKLKHQTCTLF